MAEPLEDERRTQRADPSRGQLDRQRQATEPLADGADGGRGLVAQDEVGALGSRPVLEERDARGHVEWWHAMAQLARHPEQLAARHQEPEARGAAQQARHDVGGGRQQLFQVVEDDQGDAVPQVRLQRIIDGPIR